MSQPFIEYGVLQIRPTMLLVYPRKEWFITFAKREKSEDGRESRLKGAYSGQVTKHSARRLRRALTNLIAISRPITITHPTKGYQYTFRINFITLTLPCDQGTISDKDIKTRCVDPWLKRMRRKYGLENYVWRAERQGNGNIHFHFVTDKWILYEYIRADWNDCLDPLGFIDTFEKKHGHRNPNSTDVHNVTKVRNLTNYLVKYITKPANLISNFIARPPLAKPLYKPSINPKAKRFKRLFTLEDAKIEGRIWDCSTNLKNKSSCELLLESDALEVWSNEKNNRPEHYKNLGTCELIRHTERELYDFLPAQMRVSYNAWLESIRKTKGIEKQDTREKNL